MRTSNDNTKQEVAILLETIETVTNKIVLALNRGNAIADSVFSRLLDKGVRLLNIFDPSPSPASGAPAVPLRTFLLARLELEGMVIFRSYGAKKRNMEERMDALITETASGSDEWEGRYGNENLVLAVRSEMAELTCDERKLARCLREDGVVAHAEQKLGWSHGKTMRTLKKLQEKFKKFAKLRTFRRLGCKYTFEATNL